MDWIADRFPLLEAGAVVITFALLLLAAYLGW
jgi:hypothetical protein